jgi:NitT/TauT family transport system permease protein
VAVWAAATGAGIVDPLPALARQRLAAHGPAGGQRDALADAGVSLYRIIVGFAIASVMAIPIGVVIGSYRFWEAAIEP